MTDDGWYVTYDDHLAALSTARREERERCAELADGLADINPQEAGDHETSLYQEGYQTAALELASLIRALGEGEDDG
jgi:hypothetical protein